MPRLPAHEIDYDSALLVKPRFDGWVKKSEGCWEWQGKPSPYGYGRIFIAGQACFAHRVAYLLHHGSLPQDSLVCHHCDNRLCVRPDHLFLASNKENIRDAAQKGRLMHGESHIRAKLTVEQVRAIRKTPLRKWGDMAALARYLGLDYNTVHSAYHGKTWSHVEGNNS